MKKILFLTFALLSGIISFGQSVFVNEFHYDNSGGDVNEFIEIAGPAGTDLTGWRIQNYNGNGGGEYGIVSFSGSIDDEGNGFGAVFVLTGSLQNGAPDGFALIDPSDNVVQFLSYEGSFTATDGFANGMTSTDVGVSEPGSTPIGNSLQLTGTGTEYSDFGWNSPLPDSPGDINVGQTFVAPGPTTDFTFCATDTPLDFAPPVTTSSTSAVMSTANPGDTGIIGTGLGEYTLANVTINSITDSAQDRAYLLQSPNGTILLLDDANGGTTGLDVAADLVFTDASANDITGWAGGAPLADYMPEGGDFASTFAGESIDGDWFLIVDSNPGNQAGGTVNSFCLTFEMSVGMAPEIFCPADFAADNDEGVCGAVVNFASPIAIDAEDGVLDPMNVVQTGGLPTGSEFPVGDNDVTFTATDSHGNETSCTFVISVLDAEAPMAVCQDITVILDASGNASIGNIELDGGSTDNCDVNGWSLSQNTFDCSDVGEVTVTLEVFDAAGNSTTCEAIVTVVDDIAPVIECIGGSAGPSVFINEIHYDNTGADEDEAIEIAGPAGTDLSGWSLVLYNGSNGEEYDTISLSGIIDDEGAGYGAVNFLPTGGSIQNGSPDGIVLVNNGSIVQFISYEGSLTATDGVANGMTSTDIGVSEPNSTPIGMSLQLTGTGATYAEFSWNAPMASTPGDLNVGQTIVDPVIVPPFEVDLNADGTVSVLASDLISGVDEACGYTVTVPGEAAATSLATIFGTNNNGAAGGAVYFDVTVGDNELSLESIDVNTDAASFTADVYAFEGTYVGNEGDMAAWGTPTNGTGTGAGVDMPSNVVLDAAITLSANTTYAMAVVMDATAGHFYTNGDGSNEAFSNADLSMALGAASNVPFDGSPFSPRIFNGALHYSGGATGSGPELLLDCSNLGENIVEIIVTDNSGNSSSCFATVVVSDVTAPVIVCGPGDGAVSVLEEFEGSSVPTGWSTVINSGTSDWTFGSGTMPNSDPFPTNAVIFDDDAADPAELNNVTLLSPMYDLTGGVTTASVSYDYSLDILTGGGETLAVEVYDGTAWQQIALYDADVIPPTNSGAMDVLAYANADFQVRFTYDDDSGAWAWGAGVDNFQLDYAIPPTTTEVIVELGEDGTTTLDPMDFLSEAYDACGIDVLIADLEMVTCDDIGAPITVTVFATDASGNVASCSVEVLVVDTMAPVLTCPEDESVMVDPDGSHTLADYIGDGAATATDNCTDPVSDFTQSPAPGTILGVGTHIITFTATDEYGNVSTCEMTLDLTILGTQDNELNNAIALYPNPANEQVTISNSSNIALETAMIYDLNGKLVSQINLQDMQSEQVINVSGFATGVYMVYITGEQSSVVKRLIKE